MGKWASGTGRRGETAGPNMLSAHKDGEKDPAIRLIQRKERVTADTARRRGTRAHRGQSLDATAAAGARRYRSGGLYFVTAQLIKRSELIMTHCVCRY
jgi:hypothetical protein